MADIIITPASSLMAFTSSLNYKQTITQEASGSLTLLGSGSTGRTDLFTINGNNGTLFSVSDDLSNSLFSVNTIAGLPVIEAFANNNVIMGAYGQNVLVITGSNIGIGTSSPTSKLEVNGSINLSPSSLTTSSLSFYNDLAGTPPFITNGNSIKWGYKNGDPITGPVSATDMSIINNPLLAGFFGSIMSFKIQPYGVPVPSSSDTQVNKLNLSPYNFMTGTGGVGINTTNPQASLHVYENGGLPPAYRNDFRIAKFEWNFGGVVFPNVPEDNRNMMPPEPGMVIFNTTVNKLQVYDGSNWVNLH